MLARCHYRQAKVDGVVYNLYDDAYVKVLDLFALEFYTLVKSEHVWKKINILVELFQAEDGKPDYIARIVEMFETVDKEQCFMAQWFYRAEDTVSLTFSMTCLLFFL